MKKTAILLICLSLILPLFVFGSCGNDQNTDNPDKTSTTNAIDDGSTSDEGDKAETEEVRLQPELPDDLDFGGYKMRILYRSIEENEVLFVRDIYAENEEGEAINDAVYSRNKYLEDKYNFEIVNVPSNSTSATAAPIRKIISSGSDEYDAIVMRQDQVGTLMTTNCLVDFNEMTAIDLEKPWWDASITDQLSINGKKFATVGDLIASNSIALRVIFFNKDMIASYGLESPYKMVKENTWTLDNFYSMCKDVSFDENGDGKMDENDRYGYLVQSGSTNNMFYAAGENMIFKDDNDIPQPRVLDEKSFQILQKITDILSSKDSVMFDQDYIGLDSRGPEYVLMTTFENKRGLFFAEILQLAERMRATETEFGILPPPKADANQENYLSFADSWCMNLLVVPNTNTNIERTAQILEAMAAESKYTILPAYYEKTLKGKYSRDYDSEEMLDIIIQNKVISLDEMFAWGMHSAIQTTLSNRRGDFASSIEKAAAKHAANIEKTIEKLPD